MNSSDRNRLDLKMQGYQRQHQPLEIPRQVIKMPEPLGIGTLVDIQKTANLRMRKVQMLVANRRDLFGT